MDTTNEGFGIVEGGAVLIPEGDYELRYLNYETATYFGNPKVVVHFSIVNSDEFAGLPIDRFYGVKKLTGSPGRFGNFVAQPRGHLVREYDNLLGGLGRRDRISFCQLRGKRLLGRIETVRRDSYRSVLPKCAQYSRVSQLIGLLPDEDW